MWSRRGSRERMSLEKSRDSRLGVYLFSFDQRLGAFDFKL